MMARKFLITSPDGKKYQTDNLKAFCGKWNLNYESMNNVAGGRAKTHQGWACKHVDGSSRPTDPHRHKFSVVSPELKTYFTHSLSAFSEWIEWEEDIDLPYARLFDVWTGRTGDYKGWRVFENQFDQRVNQQ